MKGRFDSLYIMLFGTVLMLAATFSYAQNHTKSFKIDISQNDVAVSRVISTDGRSFDIVSISGEYSQTGEHGMPLIPRRTVFLAVPIDAEFVSLQERTIVESTLPGEFNLYPAQRQRPVNTGIHDFIEMDAGIANSPYPYPDAVIERCEDAVLRGYKFFVFKFNPVKWTPATGRVDYISEAEFEVVYRLGEPPSTVFPPSEIYYDMAKSLAVNPTDVHKPRRRPADVGSPRYIIITSNALSESFRPLATWKTRKGIPTKIVTIEHIQASYTGIDLQAKIKNCIYDYAVTHGVEFVLLGGDETVIPAYYCYCEVNGEDPPNDPNWTLPADIYYSGLIGTDITNWNANGNGEPCEPTGDGVDLYPDVLLARAGVRTPAHVTAFVEKSVRYEVNPPLADFAKKFIVSGVELWGYIGDISDAEAKTDGMLADFILPYWSPSVTRVFDSSPGINLTAAVFQAYLDTGFGHLHMATHGGSTSWGMESGSSYSSSDASAQTNFDKQGVIATIACNSNGWDTESDPCLSEALIRNSNGGATAFFGSSRYGWGYSETPSHGSSFQYNDELYRRLLASRVHQFGRLSTETKITKVSESMTLNSMRWLQFTINPMGDPELGIRTEDPFIITATHPSHIDFGSSFTVETTPPGMTVCVWIEGESYYRTGISPFVFPAPHIEGTILVTATANNAIPYLGSIISENIFAPSPITLVAPFDDAAIGKGAGSLRPTLLWEVPSDPNDDDLHFRVQWNETPNFDPPLGTLESRHSDPGFWGGSFPIESGTHDTIGFTFPHDLVHGKTYWWRVSAWDGTNYGNWSEVRCFTVDTTLNSIMWSQRVKEQFLKSPSRAGVMFEGDAIAAIEFPTEADQFGVPIVDAGLETIMNWLHFENRLSGSFDHGQSTDHVYQGAYSYKFSLGGGMLFGGDLQQISQIFDFTRYNALFVGLFANGNNDNDRVWARILVDDEIVFEHQITTSSLDAPSIMIDISDYDGEHELALQHYVRAFSVGARKDCYYDDIRLGWTVFSSPVKYDCALNAMSWHRVWWSQAGTAGDFRLTVQRIEGGIWTDIDGLTDLEHSPYGHDISWLGHQDSIRLMGKFTYDGGAPVIEDWSVSWRYMAPVTEESELPEKLAVTAYPNPFNSACIITAPIGSKVRVYDISGRFVDELPRFEKKESTVWTPAENVGSGIYFIKVDTGRNIVTRRMVYLK